MPNGPQKLILINAGRYDYAEVELGGTLQIVGPNNTGKTSLINTLQFLYLDDRRQMDFGHSPEATRDYYFPNQYSYVLFECLGARGKFVLGWRGQSKAAGGEPERFYYEGEFASSDFVAEQDQVREPKSVSAKLSGKNYTTLKSAQDHRELLLQATKGEGQGTGIVALRDNDKYPHFREILKNLLCLSTITQDQMRDRLLMLAGLPTEKHALDVRELFGEEYRNILDQKQKLVRFKKHQDQIETLVDTCARRDTIRGELIYRWSDLRAKREKFDAANASKIEKFKKDAQDAAERIQVLLDEVKDRRAEVVSFSETKGGVQTELNQLAAQAKEFRDFVEDIEREALKNARAEINRLERELADSENKTRREAENKIQVYSDLVKQKQQTITHFDRALVTVLRRKLSDDELAPLAQLFNFDLLHQPVGEDGVRLHKHDEFVRLLKALARRIEKNVYRDELVELPLPASQHSLAQLADPDALRERLTEDQATLTHWQTILNAIVQRETLEVQLRTKREEVEGKKDVSGKEIVEGQAKRFLRFEQFQVAKGNEPRLKAEFKQAEDSLKAAGVQIGKLEKQIEVARVSKEKAEQAKVAEENQFNAVMGRFNDCVFPEFPGKPTTPDEAIPDDFDAAVGLFLRQQKKLTELDVQVRNNFHNIETTLGSDFVGADESDTIRRLREELEALPEHEEALRKNWEHQLTEMRGSCGEVLRDLDKVKGAVTDLNRAFKGVQVSNLMAICMDVIELTDLVGSLRKLANVEQPGLFDDSTRLEAVLGGFRQKFENNPLLRYADLFTLRFTVTGDDGKPHHYHDFKQGVESHGTTITIKVLFNLLVLRSLLREDSSKSLLCEVPFFLDEIHSLDPTNRHAVLTTARKLGFIAITAAPESVSEVDALYFLQPQKGRIVLRHKHRVAVKRASAASKR